MNKVSKNQIDGFLEVRLEADYWFSFDDRKQIAAIHSCIDVLNGCLIDEYRLVLSNDDNYDLPDNLLSAAAYAAYSMLVDEYMTSKKLLMLGSVVLEDGEDCGCSNDAGAWAKVYAALDGCMRSGVKTAKIKLSGGGEY